MGSEVGRGLLGPGCPSPFTPFPAPGLWPRSPSPDSAPQLTVLSRPPSPPLWDWCQGEKGTLALTVSGNSRPPWSRREGVPVSLRSQ